MLIGAGEPCALPDDPVLADWATVLRDTGDWGWILDARWNLVYMTDEQRMSFAAGVEMVPVVIGEHLFGPASVAMSTHWRTGPTRQRSWRELFASIGGLALADTAGGRDELRSLVDPALADMVDELSPTSTTAIAGTTVATSTTRDVPVMSKAVRICDAEGGLRGTAVLFKPAIGMDVLGAMAFERDLRHVERLQTVSRARRRPTAILFGDLEGSSKLSRTLSTSNYFATGRRIVRATDQAVVDAGGIVGRHVGDGVVAFFPAEVFDSESAAAGACVTTAHRIAAAMPDVAARCGLDPGDLVMRFGLHWGSTVFMGNISTAARSEVTALGDEVNEAARIEACATGGRTLASKPLVERLDEDIAPGLGIEPDQLTYVQLSDLNSATDKARRDAPAIAVCELQA